MLFFDRYINIFQLKIFENNQCSRARGYRALLYYNMHYAQKSLNASSVGAAAACCCRGRSAQRCLNLMNGVRAGMFCGAGYVMNLYQNIRWPHRRVYSMGRTSPLSLPSPRYHHRIFCVITTCDLYSIL